MTVRRRTGAVRLVVGPGLLHVLTADGWERWMYAAQRDGPFRYIAGPYTHYAILYDTRTADL